MTDDKDNVVDMMDREEGAAPIEEVAAEPAVAETEHGFDGNLSDTPMARYVGVSACQAEGCDCGRIFLLLAAESGGAKPLALAAVPAAAFREFLVQGFEVLEDVEAQEASRRKARKH